MGEDFYNLIVITSILVLARTILLWFLLKLPINLQGYARALFMGSVETVPIGMLWEGFPPVGIVWFSFALFGSRMIWNVINIIKNKIIIYTCVIMFTIYGVIIGPYQWLPFCLDCCMSILLFHLIGYLWKENSIKKIHFQYLGIFWILFF